jgi:hypothetical protein
MKLHKRSEEEIKKVADEIFDYITIEHPEIECNGDVEAIAPYIIEQLKKYTRSL